MSFNIATGGLLVSYPSKSSDGTFQTHWQSWRFPTSNYFLHRPTKRTASHKDFYSVWFARNQEKVTEISKFWRTLQSKWVVGLQLRLRLPDPFSLTSHLNPKLALAIHLASSTLVQFPLQISSPEASDSPKQRNPREEKEFVIAALDLGALLLVQYHHLYSLSRSLFLYSRWS